MKDPDHLKPEHVPVRDEYLRRVELIQSAICELEKWLAGMTPAERATFLICDPTTYGGAVCLVEDFVESLEENARETVEEDEA